MNNSIFFSEGRYVSLPFFKKRVTLNVNTPKIIKQALELYNPFSKKAKYIKQFYTKYIFASSLFTRWFSKTYHQGEFINHLEQMFHEKLTSSLYYPTVKDKLVLQLLDSNENIFGYLKIGLNRLGNKKVSNEFRGINEMISRSFLDTKYLIHSGGYGEHKFIIVKAIEGKTINSLAQRKIDEILECLKKKDSFTLNEHPGFLKLIDKAKLWQQDELLKALLNIKKSSTASYRLVLEHGDFALWNMFESEDGTLQLFDYEYYSDKGIEYMDMFNYYYQNGKLLMKLEFENLIAYMKDNMQLNEFDEMLKVFLINKILNQVEEHSSLTDEMELLTMLNTHKR